MVGDADPHFPAAESQGFLGAQEGLEEPHIGARGEPLDEPEPGIVQVAKFPELGDIRAKQGKVALVPFPGDAAQFFDPLLRPEGAGYRPAGIQGQGQEAPIGEERRGPGKNAVIGISGGYILNHGIKCL
jgi:hypothetical protein